MSSKEMIEKQNDLITRAEILPSERNGSTRITEKMVGFQMGAIMVHQKQMLTKQARQVK